MGLELGTAKFGHFAENADTNPDFCLLVFETALSLILGRWACRLTCETSVIAGGPEQLDSNDLKGQKRMAWLGLVGLDWVSRTSAPCIDDRCCCRLPFPAGVQQAHYTF